MHPILSRFLRKVPLGEDVQLDAVPRTDTSLDIILSHKQVRRTMKGAPLTRPYRSALARMLAADKDVEVVITENIPKGFPSVAASYGLGYLDVEGAGFVEGDGMRYVREPEKKPSPEASSSPFAPRASRAVRALLCHEVGRRWRLGELAAEAEIDPGNLRRILVSLIHSGFVERDGDNYLMVDPTGLLDAWASSRKAPRERLYLPQAQDELRSQIRRLHTLLGKEAFVVSGELAAEYHAPFLRAARTLVHCMDQKVWEELQDWSSTQEGPAAPKEMILVDRSDEGVAKYGVHRDDLLLAAPVQVYVDLQMEKGRALEAARHLRDQVIGF